MAGGSPNHNLIGANVIGELVVHLRGGPCRVYTSDQRIKVSATGLYTYSDAVVVCGPSEFDAEQRETLLNPTLIVEVLSPGTEAYVRGDKFEQYRQLPSLQEYVLVSQDRVRVERYERQPGETWLYTAVVQPDAVLHLPSIGCDLRLAEVYAQVTLPSSAALQRE
jgi:Uma2 family endonuclease